MTRRSWLKFARILFNPLSIANIGSAHKYFRRCIHACIMIWITTLFIDWVDRFTIDKLNYGSTCKQTHYKQERIRQLKDDPIYRLGTSCEFSLGYQHFSLILRLEVASQSLETYAGLIYFSCVSSKTEPVAICIRPVSKTCCEMRFAKIGVVQAAALLLFTRRRSQIEVSKYIPALLLYRTVTLDYITQPGSRQKQLGKQFLTSVSETFREIWNVPQNVFGNQALEIMLRWFVVPVT